MDSKSTSSSSDRIFPTTINSTTLLFSLVVTLSITILPTWYFFFNSNKKKRKQQQQEGKSKKNKKTSSSAHDDDIPWATGGKSIPILGHALAYKSNPAQFLSSTSFQHNIFQINLAGKHMYVVAGYNQQHQLANLPESQLSARKAVANIGFEQTLGQYNVHFGTDLHKPIIKSIWHHHPQQVVTQLCDKLQHSLYTEIIIDNNNDTKKQYHDFFKLIRRVVLRSMIDWMISPLFLEIYDNSNNNNNFIDEFMSFQDQLEDITAKSVVLPRWIALPLMLLPLQKRRLHLQNKIKVALEKLLSTTSSDDDDDNDNNTKQGFWLKQIVVETRDSEGKPNLSIVSELVVGLLFAAHKNPAIGAAQSYLLLLEQGTQEDQDLCTSEAQRLLQSPDYHTLNSCQRLRRICLETLRLTAHSIGAVRVAQTDIRVTKTSSMKSGGDGHGNNGQKQQHIITNNPNNNSNSYWIIPKGSTIAFPHISSSWNSNYWINPHDIDTSTNHRSEELYKDEYKFTTFSNGIHKCPGQPIAMVILQCMLAILLQTYSITIQESSIPEISFERATLAQRSKPVMVSIQPKG